MVNSTYSFTRIAHSNTYDQY